MGNAHRDRIICPQCLKPMRDRNALRSHMKATRHVRAVHPVTDDDVARAKMQHLHQDLLRRQIAPRAPATGREG